MLFVIDILEKKKTDSLFKTEKRLVSKLIEADSEANAEIKLNEYYTSLETEDINYEISINSITSTLQGSTTTQISGSLTLDGSLLNPGTVNLTHTDSPYTITSTEQFLLIDPSGGDVIVNMPDAATYPGREIRFKLTQAAGANTVTLQRQGADTIDGATTYTDLDIQYESISTVSNGSDGWFIF
jgi:hypothetical protein